MKILFNCTINTAGGGVKNSALFIKHVYESGLAYRFLFAISSAVEDALKDLNIVTRQMFVFDKSPAYSYQARKDLKRISELSEVELVYTMAGPAYVNFKKKHVMGISNPYITHAELQDYIVEKRIDTLIAKVLKTRYQNYYARKASFWLFQTEYTRNKFIQKFKVPISDTYVIPNAIGNDFIQDMLLCNECYEPINYRDTVKIFCPAAAYPHKCLHLIPMIAKKLKEICKNKYRFCFITTIDETSSLNKYINTQKKLLGVEDCIKNIGPFNYSKARSLYLSSQLVFVPSILETFSSSYLEAFATCKPLITADKVFAREICDNASLYINPFEFYKTAEVIHKLISSQSLQYNLVCNGVERLSSYPNQSIRMKNILNYLMRHC